MENKNNHIDELCINTIRFLSVDAVEKAKSGHPGMPMGDAKMAYALWKKFLRHSPKNPKWAGRDRFVLSAGHGSMLLYSLLHLTGYDLTIDDLKNFRQWGSHTPGHPEYDLKRGIETTTGPLGQGFANGVGMAIAQKYLADRYNKPGHNLFDYFIYAITSDGDLMEGVSNEAASIAGHLGLGHIVYLYSDNKITIEGSTDIAFTEDVGKRFEALKWHVVRADGNDLDGITHAIDEARKEKTRPSLVIVRTNIGFGSPAKQDSSEAHGSPLGPDEAKAAKKKLGWPDDAPEFHVPQEVAKAMNAAVEKGEFLEKEWNSNFHHYEKAFPELAKEVKAILSGNFDTGWESDLPKFSAKDSAVATRSVSGKVLNAIAKKTPFLIGGSADLAPSNNTFLKDMGVFEPGKSGRNIHYGVREHAMGSIMNGIAQGGILIPYGGTFLVFSDYMRPAIRVAALSGFHVIYVFTHDSIGLGEDGPTHQPIEHLSALRAMPNLTVLRPADAVETVEAWRIALKRNKGPVALSLTRQNLPVIDREKYGKSTVADIARGGYVIAGADSTPEVVLIATGSEVEIALGAYDKLQAKGVKARVVSMPATNIFDEQDEAYRNSVLPPTVKTRIAIEAGCTHGWHKYTSSHGEVIGIDRFGASAPYKTIYEKLGLTADNVSTRALKLLGK
ncbi:MAG: transketolase [Deltaproteobacteria bacterium]|nr:transketolase [Deltaproteobacteria bacterium]